MSLYEELEQRGLLSQSTHPEQTRKLFRENQGVSVYTGFDPTADSLHIGHLIPIMGLARVQRAGHHPIALIGSGTALIGDPTGKSEIRKMLSKEDIGYNLEKIKKQLQCFIDFENGKASLVNNLDWLGSLNYLDVLRDIGKHFSVNRMLTAECFKARMETGLSFIEFNYMILQAYDFLHLFREHNCLVQLGGDDQWSNMIAGSDLIRRKESKEAYALTYPLLTTSDGKKMGKTEKGAVWLDAEKTSPYEYFQYWRNVPDDKVKECLYIFTFLEHEKINDLCKCEGAGINQVKEVLAFEATKILHGQTEAENAKGAAQAAFSGGQKRENIPSTELLKSDYPNGLKVVEMLKQAQLTSSNKEGRRLISGGGVYLDGERIEDPDFEISAGEYKENYELRKGKKNHHLIQLI